MPLAPQCMSSSMSSTNGCDQEVSCKLSKFGLLSEGDVEKLINCLNTKSCMLDPIPTWYLKDNSSTFVHAISNVINTSFSTGEFPMSLKRAVITPIIKKPSLNPDELKNYRPVSSLPFLSKVIEKYVVNTITEHMIDNGLGEPLQSAYRRAHGTETALLKVKSDIMYSIHNQQGVFLVLLDLSCAFDTVDHVILLSRMEKEIGLSDIALQWLKSYFSNRVSRVRIDDELSAEHVMNYGLPQGSTVGPLSFIVYIIPLGRIITKYGLSYHMYADDLQLYISFDLTQCINETRSWMTANMLKLNNDKTEFFIAISPHNKQRMPPVTLQVGPDIIHSSETVRNLGVIFDTHMTMTSHISSICGSLNTHLRNITRIRRYLDSDTCNHIVRSLVLSRLDYGNALLLGSNQTDIARLQRLQNWGAKLIFRATKYDHASPFLQQLHWLPVKERIAFKILMCVFKAINGIAPDYVSSLLTLYAPARGGLRSSTDVTRLEVPKIRNRTLKSTADKTFFLTAPSMWNSLPQSIRSTGSLPVFKKGLKSHLFPEL